MSLRHLDLFSGIGGFMLAAKRAGFTTIQAVEIEPFCRAVIAKNFPEVPLHDDVRTYSAAHLCGTVGLLTGGFPCQDISIAGKGAGIEGERSGLWWEMFRIITECRPAFVLIENVPALRNRGADRVLSELEGAGYTGRAFVVGADDIGATHRRKRVWIVADDANRRRNEPGASSERERCEREDRGCGCDVAYSDSSGWGEHSGEVSGEEELPSSQHRSATISFEEWIAGTGDTGGTYEEWWQIYGADAGLPYPDVADIKSVTEHEPGNENLPVSSGRGTRLDNRRSGKLLPAFPPARNDFRGWAAVASVDATLMPCVERDVRDVVDGIPIKLVRRRRNATLKALGNAIVPQVAELFCQWIYQQLRSDI